MRYKAFISYSHTDKGLAERLEGALQVFGKAWYQPRARRVFRDESNIHLGPLPDGVASALEDSEFFLLLASPSAAESGWVTREVDSWLERHGTTNLLIVLTSGTIAWAEDLSGYDPKRTTALPPALINAFSREPLYADLSWARELGDLTLDNPDFKKTIAQLTATLEDRSLEDMIGAEIEQHNRTRRIRSAAVATLSVLLALAIVFAGLAAWQKRVAQSERAEAERQRDRALARQLATASREALERREWTLGGLLALESIRRDWTPAGFEAWQRALELLPPSTKTLASPGPVTDLHFTADGTLLVGKSGNSLLRWDISTSTPSLLRKPHRWAQNPRGHPTFALDSTRQRLVTTDGARVLVWDPRTLDSTSRSIQGNGNEVIAVAISPDGQWIAALCRRAPGLMIWKTEDSGAAHIVAAFDDGEAIMSYAFSPDSRWFAVGSRTSIQVWDVDSGEEQSLEEPPWDRAWGPVAFSPDRRWLVNWQGGVWRTGDWRYVERVNPGTYRTPFGFSAGKWLAMHDGLRVSVLAVDSWEQNPALPELHGESPVFSPDDRWLATRSHRGVELGDLSGKVPPRWIEQTAVTAVTFSPDSRWLATAGSDGTVHLWQTDTLREESRLSLDAAVSALAFSPSSDRIATADGTSVRLWDVVSHAVEIRPRTTASTSGSDDSLSTQRRGDRLTVVRGDGRTKLFEVAHAPRFDDSVVSPDGRWVAVPITRAYRAGATTRLWDLEALEAREIEATPLTFTPDSRNLLAYSHEDSGTTLILLALNSSRPPVTWAELETGGWVNPTAPVVAFSADGTTAAIGTGARTRDRRFAPLSGRLSVWRVGDWSLRHEMAFEAPVAGVDLSPDGDLIAMSISAGSTGEQGNLLISDGVQARDLNAGAIDGSPRFTADGLALIAVTLGQRLQVWTLPDGRLLSDDLHRTDVGIAGRAAVWSVSADGKLVAVATSDGDIRVRDSASGEEVWRAFHGGAIAALAFSENGRELKSFSRDGHVQVWQAHTGLPVDHDNAAWGRQRLEGLARALARHPVESPVWDDITGRYGVTVTTTSPDKEWLATSGEDQVVRIWTIPGGGHVARLPHRQTPRGLLFDDEGRWLAITSANEVCVWSTGSWERQSCKSHAARVDKVVFSRSGSHVASVSRGSVRIWRPGHQDRTPIVQHGGNVRAVAFSADEQLVATASDAGELGVWRVPSGEAILTTTLDRPVSAAALSPSNEWLAVVANGDIRVLETRTGQEVGRFVVADFRAVGFTPDGESLVGSTASDEFLLPWSTAALVAGACSRLSRNLSYQEWHLYMVGQAYQATCPDLPPHPSLQAEADRRIQQGDFDGAVEMLALIHHLDPDGGDPGRDAERRAAPALLVQGGQLAKRGRIKEAIQAYTRARALDSEMQIAPRAWNTLCWYGSLWGQPRRVLQHCERAVTLGAQNARLRDSRGLARALTGDYRGAIDDFESYINDASIQEEEKERRRHWIRTLDAGENPFTPEVLEALRGEQAEPEAFL